MLVCGNKQLNWLLLGHVARVISEKKWKASIFSEQMWLFILRASGIRSKAVVRWFLAGSLYAHQFRINNRRCLTCSWGKLDWFEHSYSVKVKIPIAVINWCLVLVGSFSIMRNTKVFKRTVSKNRGKLIIKMYSGTCKSMCNWYWFHLFCSIARAWLKVHWTCSA